MFPNIKKARVRPVLIAVTCLVSGRIYAIVPSTSYSQSGLVTHWDAIDNVLSEGVRMHSSDTAIWYDLTGNGYDLDLPAGKSVWEDAALEFLGNGRVGTMDTTAVPQDTYAGVKTVEMTYSDLMGNEYAAIFCPWVKKEFQIFSSGQHQAGDQAALTGFYDNLAASVGPRVLTNTWSCIYDNPGSGPVGILSVYCNSEKAVLKGGSSRCSISTGVSIGGRSGVVSGNWSKGRMFSLRLYTRELTLAERMLNAFVDDNRFLGGSQSARFAALGFRDGGDAVQVKASFACQDGVTASFSGAQHVEEDSLWVDAGSTVTVLADDSSCIWLGAPAGSTVSGGSVVVSGAQAPFNLYAIKPTHVWTGGSGDDFSTVENWVDASGNAVTAAPTADSVVYIPAAQDTDVTNTVVVSAAIDVKELHVGSGRGEQGAVFVVVSNKLENLIGDRFVVYPGAVVTHLQNSSAKVIGAEEYRAAFTAGDIDVLLGGEINVDGKGFAAKTPDTTNYGGINLASCGSSHGGHNLKAAMGELTGGRKVYDSVYYPTNSGSGSYLLAGGGIVRLSATGRITVNGSVTANSEDKSSTSLAGAGGAVLLEAHDVAGGGCISANGGFFVASSRGSGGRIAVHMTSEGDDFGCKLSAYSNANEEDRSGGPGTIYIRRGGQPLCQGELIIDNSNLGTVTNSIAELTEDDVSFGKLTIRNKGRLYVRAGQTIRVNGDFDVRGGSITNAPGSTFDFSGATQANIRGNVDFFSFICTNSAASLGFETPAGGHIGILPGGSMQIAGDSTRLVPVCPADGSHTWNLEIGPNADIDVLYAAIGGCNASDSEWTLVATHSEDLGGNSRVVFQGDIEDGEVISWTGGASSADWNDPENWLDAKNRVRLPVSTDLVTIPASTECFPALFSGSVSVGGLNVAGMLTLSNCNFRVGQAASVSGTLELCYGAHLVCSNDLAFAEGSGVSASEFSFVQFAGGAEQSFNPCGHRFGCVYVLKNGGSIAVADGFAARCLYIAPSGRISATFAAGTLVDVEYLVADGLASSESSISLGSSLPGSKWGLKVGRHAFASALAVADCDASEGRTVEANANCSGEGCSNWTFAADSKIWTGAAGRSFSAASNWSPAGVPGSGSDLIVFDRKTMVQIDSAVSANSLVFYSPENAVIVSNKAELAVAGDFTVEGHVVAALNKHIEVGGSVFFGNKSIITHQGPAKSPVSAVDISCAGDFTLSAGAGIDVCARGYSPADGPGAGGGANGPVTAHGGTCLLLASVTKHNCYGSILAPSLCGSGGFSLNGSSGGGLVTISSDGVFTLDGRINANGSDAPRSAAGGSVYITCARLSGNGVITANGGYTLQYYCGGGGRVALVQTEARDFAAFTGSASAVNNNLPAAAGAGTLFMKSAGEGGTVVVSNTFFSANAITEFPMADDGNPKTAYKDVSFVVPANGMLSLLGDCTIADLDLQSETSKIELNGYTLKVKSLRHNKGRGWGASYQSLVSESGGTILWQPGFSVTVR